MIQEVKNKLKTSRLGHPTYHDVDYTYSNEYKCMVPNFKNKVNRYAMIQASKAKVDISDIVKRAQMGDISVLNVKQALPYDDISQVPDNINEAHGLNAVALNAWSSLNPEIKNIFANDIDKFAAEAEAGTVNKTVAEYYKNKAAKVAEKKDGE